MTGADRDDDLPERDGAGASDGESPDREDGGGRPEGAEGGGGRDRPDLLAEAVDRMAHQIKNPLQAVAMNLEVIRMRVRDEAPELWSEIRRHGEAVDENVDVLDRRLRLLLRLGRRSTDETRESLDVARLIADFATALQLGEEPPGLEVRPEGTQLAARARPGYVLALVLDLWHALRAWPSGGPELRFTVRAEEGEVVVAARLPAAASDVASGEARDRWERTARAAGGRLEVDGGDGAGSTVRLVLPAD